MTLLSLLFFAAASSAEVLSSEHNEQLMKRQDFMSKIGSSFGAKLGRMKGEPGGAELFISLARMMGASKSSPGSIGSFMKSTLNSGYGLKPAKADGPARRTVLPSRTNVTGSKTIKIRYGPYSVPGSKHVNLLGEHGMLSNYPHKKWEKPCAGECTMIGLSPGLEYEDGKSANIDSGMWLHHMVLFNTGPGRRDYTCGDKDISLPHSVAGVTPRNSERIFASGNERTACVFPNWGVRDAGYKLKSTDGFDVVLELMNENTQVNTVYVTMTYDIVEGHPFKDDVRIVWLDIGQCGTSESNPPKGKPVFTLDYSWKSNVDGQVIAAIGHLHDGGSRVTLSVDGKQTCDSSATYGGTPEYVQKSASGVHAHGALTHLSDMTQCNRQSLPRDRIAKGQNWSMNAEYDFNKHKGMMHEDGNWDEVMGIALMFVRIAGS